MVNLSQTIRTEKKLLNFAEQEEQMAESFLQRWICLAEE